MTVQADSRYADGEYVVVTLADGETSRMLWQADLTLQGIEYQHYMVMQGDRFDTIATRAYGDPTKWWMIADLNPEVYWPADLVPGTYLRIPLANYDVATNQFNNFVFTGSDAVTSNA